MAGTILIVPPYSTDHTASFNGRTGQIIQLVANRATGKIQLEVAMMEPAGPPVVESIGALGAVCVLLDPGPGQDLIVEAAMHHALLRARSTAVNRADVNSTGYAGLFVIQRDGNNRNVGVPIFEIEQIWNNIAITGTSDYRLNRNDIIRGQTALTIGHTYMAFAWAAVVCSINMRNPGPPLNVRRRSRVANFLETTVNSFTATIT